MLPASMAPGSYLPPEHLEDHYICQCCNSVFTGKSGVIYISYFKKQEVQHYGPVFICTLTCLLKSYPQEGTA